MGVKFEADNIYTLDSNGRMILTILASVAEEESHQVYGIGSHDLRGFWVGQENVLSADRKSFSTAATCFV